MATTEKGSPELGFPRQESVSCRAFCSCRVRCGPIRRPDGRMRLGAPTSSPLPLRSPRKPRPTRWLQAAEHGPTRHPHPLLRGVDHDGSVRCRHSAGAVRRLRRGVEEDRRIEPGPPPGRPPRRPYGVGLTPTMPRLGRQVVTVTRELGRSLGLGRHRWTGREQVAESRTPPMSAGGLDNFLRSDPQEDVDGGMEFNSATGQHCSHQERDWDAVDSASARRLFFDAHPVRCLAIAGHGYPVGSRLSRLGRQLDSG